MQLMDGMHCNYHIKLLLYVLLEYFEIVCCVAPNRPQGIMLQILLIMLFRISPKIPHYALYYFFMLLIVIIIP